MTVAQGSVMLLAGVNATGPVSPKDADYAAGPESLPLLRIGMDDAAVAQRCRLAGVPAGSPAVCPITITVVGLASSL